jgi:hypothetical protein
VVVDDHHATGHAAIVTLRTRACVRASTQA